jgi:GT2 family glycosyltransferase
MYGPLSIIIVSYNSGPFLEKCLNAIFREEHGFSVKVILVDNHSRDGSIERIETEFPELTCVRNNQNLGFAKACNQGLELANGEYVLFLNPDAFIKSDTLARCVTFMDVNTDVGMMGCRLLNMDGTFQPSCSDFPYIHKLFLDHLLRNRIFPHALRHRLLLKYWTHDQIREVDWILGAFMLSRLGLLKELRGFDEDFFLYGEDMELCYRIKQNRWKIAFFPDAMVMHMGNPVWDSKRVLRVHKAILMFYKKHFSLPKKAFLQLIMKIDSFLSCQPSV